jgi:hypothetical protein
MGSKFTGLSSFAQENLWIDWLSKSAGFAKSPFFSQKLKINHGI